MSEFLRKNVVYVALFVSFFYLFSFKEENLPSNNVLNVLTEYFETGDNENFVSMITANGFEESYKDYDCSTRGKIEHLIGKFYYTDNQEKKAIQYFKKALNESWINCDKVTAFDISNTLYNIGVSYHYTNEILEGKKFIDSAFLMIASIPDYPKDVLASKYQGAGSYYSDVPDFLRAETYFRNALSLSDHISEIKSFDINIDLIILYLKFKKYDAARAILREVNEKFIKRNSSISSIEKAIFYLNFSEYYFVQRNFSEAINYCNQAIELLPPEEVDYLSNAHEILGSIYNELHKYELSIQHFETSYKLRLEGENIVSANIAKAYGLENLAELELARKNFDKAVVNINEAILLVSSGLKTDKDQNPILNVKSISNSGQLIRQLYLKSKILTESYRFDKKFEKLYTCVSNYKKIDTLVENLVYSAAFDQSVIKTLENLPDYTDQAISTFILMYHLTKNKDYLHLSFEFSSKSKSIALKKLAENNRRFNRSTNEQLKSEYIKLSNELNDVQNKLVEKDGSRDSLQIIFSRRQLDMDRLLQKNITLEKANTFEIQLMKLKTAMDNKTVVIDFYTGSDSLYIFMLLKNDLKYKVLPSNAFSTLIKDLKASLQSPLKTYNNKNAYLLYNMFLKDFLEQQATISRLVFIPNGEATNFPFETLQGPDGKFLVENYYISYAYHLGMLLNTEGDKISKFKFSGFATNYSDSLTYRIQNKGINNDVTKINKLVSANAELESCGSIFSKHYFYDKEANLENFKTYGRQAEILYLSLHAVLDTIDGANSCLIFDDGNEHFLLHSYELYQQPLSADLVILSSCNSAAGDQHQNEGIIGLSRAFLSSGVQNLVSSLWLVSEASSVEILPDFLNNYSQGKSKTEALAMSKRKYLKSAPPSQKHPYYWSNFILIANLENEGPGYKTTFYWLFGILSMIILTYFVHRKYIQK